MQGGIGAYTRILATQYSQQGHDVFIFADHRATETVSAIHLTATAKHWGIKTLWDIRTWANQHQLDVINLQFETAAYQMSGWIHALPHIVPNIPFITTFHDLLTPYLFPKAGKLRPAVVNHLAKQSTGVIVTNHEDHLKLNASDSVLIPIGSNIPDTLPVNYDRVEWRKRASATDNDFLIAYFGFLNHSKGVDRLLEDTANLIKQGYQLKLVLIGDRIGTSDHANIKYAQVIDHLIQDLDLERYITWTGFIDEIEVSAYLQSADAVALPFTDGASYRRGTLMAAIQHKRPIITTPPKIDIPLFVDRENMMFGTKNNHNQMSIASCIVDLYDNPELSSTLQAGAKALSKHFQWDNIAQQTLDFFQKIINLRSS